MWLLWLKWGKCCYISIHWPVKEFKMEKKTGRYNQMKRGYEDVDVNVRTLWYGNGACACLWMSVQTVKLGSVTSGNCSWILFLFFLSSISFYVPEKNKGKANKGTETGISLRIIWEDVDKCLYPVINCEICFVSFFFDSVLTSPNLNDYREV